MKKIKDNTNICNNLNDIYLRIRNKKEYEEFKKLDFPFYSIAVDKLNDKKIVIETPFLKSCHILIAQYLFGSRDKAAILFVNGRPVRKIRLEDTNPEYMARISTALLDYLKRYVLLKNKFLQ